MAKKRYAVLGAGAIGGYAAVKLYQAGFDVHAAFRSDYSHVVQNGLRLQTDTETVTVAIPAYQDLRDAPPCDVILVAWKTTENALLKTVLPQLIGPHTVVVMMQNGIGVEQEVAKIVFAQCIVGCSTFLKVTKIAPGLIRHFGLNQLEFAQYYQDEHKQEISEQVKHLVQDFKQAGMDAQAVKHLPTMRWHKLVGNIPLSGLSVVLNASLQELVFNSASYELLLALTQEVIDTAKHCGAEIAKDFFKERLQILESFKKMAPSNPSMRDDFDAKRPLELGAIYKNPLAIAKAHQVDMPLTTMLYRQLLFKCNC